MLVVVLAAAAIFNGLGSLAALVWLVVAVIRERPASREELERASMRSLSWPTRNDD